MHISWLNLCKKVWLFAFGLHSCDELHLKKFWYKDWRWSGFPACFQSQLEKLSLVATLREHALHRIIKSWTDNFQAWELYIKTNRMLLHWSGRDLYIVRLKLTIAGPPDSQIETWPTHGSRLNCEATLRSQIAKMILPARDRALCQNTFSQCSFRQSSRPQKHRVQNTRRCSAEANNEGKNDRMWQGFKATALAVCASVCIARMPVASYAAIEAEKTLDPDIPVVSLPASVFRSEQVNCSQMGHHSCRVQ